MAHRWVPWSLTLLGLATAWVGSAFAAQQEMPCDMCHDDVALTAPPHGDFDCNMCHSNIAEAPHQDAPLQELGGAAICSQCHDRALEALEPSIHGGVLECTDCHGEAHSVLSPRELTSPTSPLRQIQSCGGCHDTDHLIDRYVGSVHGHALVVSGLINAPSCSDCHGSHAVFPVSDSRSTVSSRHVPETCGTCHQYILDTWQQHSVHGRNWLEGKEAPVCTTCHSSHDVLEPDRGEQRLKFPESCGGCHGYRYDTYRDSFHGQVTHLGFMTAATCSDCHTPHQNLPASDPESTVHPGRLMETCGRCHEDVTPAFLTFSPHLDPSDSSQNWAVYLVWVFMTGLLISVFSFFGVHDLLWLQRSAVGLLRKEFKVFARSEGPYVRRFESSHVWLHVTIVSSFLLLAATGLPLKFHYAEWATRVAAVFGGIGNARWIHRVAALVTFGYAFYHLGYLFRRVVLRNDYGLLWGWRSMVPQRQDVVDLWHNVRYFLYAGPRPTHDRWTYWEKFDYFAVFWGVVIIGSSGLMLWLPGFFTRFLPGWMLNAAFVIHSDEALLATGFIFVFHFFHTHLRPEAFPLDQAVFTGCVPLERFKEERPVEYRRLVDSGKLEQLFVDTPTRRQVRRTYLFGFSALAVGLALAIGILAAFVAH